MRYGLSMFGLNPLFLEDKEGFLQKISAMGYRYMEPCWMMMSIPGLEKHGWTEADFAENQPLLEKYGVSIYSLHVFPNNLSEDLADILRVAKTYGVQQVVLPCPKEVNPAMAAHLNQVADALKAHGVEFLLHNARNDAAGFDWLMMATGENVGAQVDVGWLLYDGFDPETSLNKYGDKVRSLHYKDFTADKNETAVGTGLVDMEACSKFARERELIEYVDQDGSNGDFLEDMANAIDLLKRLADGK